MTSPEFIRIGTRSSALALYQARLVADAIHVASDGILTGEIVTFTTKGDQLTTERLINSGGKGLFTREIDHAVDTGAVDIAVHSLKDVPSLLPDGQEIVAYPKRADPRDGFLSIGGVTRLSDLPKNAILGTASLRREAQALRLRSDLKVIPFRGKVETRIKKLEDGLADATFLAMAGLARLDLAHLAHPIGLDELLPAAGQGIIAVAARPEKLTPGLKGALAILDHTPTRCAAIAERAVLTELDGSCRTAIAAHMNNSDGHWRLRGEVLSPDGQQCWNAEATALLSTDHAGLADFGRALGQSIREAAGGNLPAFEGV